MKKLIVSFCLFIAFACEKDGFSGTEDEQIEQYLTANALVPNEKSTDGLRVIYTTQSNGALPKKGQSVNLNYSGFLLNGKKFDSGNFSFTLGSGQAIKGFDLGIAKSKVGQKTKLIFPSSLGYGSSGQGSIPANSPLIFDIEILSIK